MHRFWIDPSCVKNNHILIKGALFHHICRVCRFKEGAKFIILSGGRLPYIVQLNQISPFQATAQILKQIPLPPRSKPYIHIALSCPRFSVLEGVLKKFVELNVNAFHPFVSDLSFIRKISSLSKKREERWQTIIQHSMAQSMNSEGMKIYPMLHLKSLLDQYQKLSKTKALFFCEHQEGCSLKKMLESISFDSLDQIWIFIGGEGGFSPREISLFKSYKINPVTLGQQILKVETACLTVLGVLKYKLGQL